MGGPWAGKVKELNHPLNPVLAVPWPREPLTISPSAAPQNTLLDVFYYDLHHLDYGETVYLYTPRGWTDLDIIQRLLSWYVR